MLLKNILNGNLSIEVLLIKDDCYTSGLIVLKEILRSFKVLEGSFIHMFNYERQHYDLNEDGLMYQVIQYNCFSSLCYWKQPSDEVTLKKVVSSMLKEVPSSQQVIVVDSMSYPLMTDGIHQLSCTINRLSSLKFKSGFQVFPMIYILHNFDEDNVEHRQLEHQSNLILCVSSGSETQPDRLMLSISHKKPSGRLVFEKYTCWFDPSSNKFSYEEVKEPVVSPQDNIEGPDITSLTTFKLTLEDKELESRNKLILPHMRRQEAERSGMIYYEPDANDDWDDEDPDDDLEI